MKRLLWLIVAMAGLVAVVTGCGGTPRYDGRLAAADSLMHDDPDSALALVEAIDAGSLTTDGDRAYRDLLLTQARYRCYIAATSDSAINRALAYYRAHDGEREKLTRCYLYKGAVMEELGQVDSAMFHYKTAEATAAPDDYFNLGYAKLRIATLYQDQLSQDSIAIQYLKGAIHCFEILEDTSFLISCYGGLGAVCGVKHPDSTEYYLTYAIKLAQQFKPSMQYTYKSKLAGFELYYKKDYKRANILSMDVLRNGQKDCNESQFYYYVVLSYLRLGQVDSAICIFNIIPSPTDKVDSMNYYNVLAELGKEKRFDNSYALNSNKSLSLSNDILSSSKEKQLIKTEAAFEKQRIEKNNSTLSKFNRYLKVILFITGLLLLFTAAFAWLSGKALRRQRHEQESIRAELEKALSELKQRKENSAGTVSQLVGYRISAINELFQEIRYKFKDKDANNKNGIVTFSSVLKNLNEQYALMQVNLSDSFWAKMKLSVDGEYNGILSFVEARYNLTEQDIKLFCLLCADISPQLIKLCMNYTSSKTSSTYRNRLIKKKIGLDMTFSQFVEQYMAGLIK